ncbi:MAG: phosphatase PAP2 family protein [Oscillospiraceae bacterium]
MIDFIQNLDANALLFIQDNLRTPFFDGFFVFITKLGDFGLLWIALGLALLIPKKTRRGALTLLLALLLTLIVNNYLIKPLVARPRPYSTIEGLSIIVERLGSFSFPSGHASSSFAAATIFALVFGTKGAWAFLPAVLIAFSRCYVGVHYPSDVLVGALVGTAVALGVYFLPLCFGRQKSNC